MKASIDLSPEEQRVLDNYLKPSESGIPRATRLSIQYAIGAGLFLIMAIWQNEPLYALGTYGVFLIYMLLRIIGAKRVVGIMPGIIEKYEKRIQELEAKPNESQEE